MMEFASAVLRLVGWRLVGRAPDVSRCVIIFAPHTSNWDFPIMLLVKFAFRHRVHYLAKHSLFRFPVAWFFRATGGIPVERGERHDLVATMAKAFAERPTLWLAVAPEGTRARRDHWKSGFYHIALEAKVPVLLAFLDAGNKECGLGPVVELSGDVERDLATIRAFYSDKQAIRPERTGEIRFEN
ncbi:MAG TPA: lysophospholipid acyltransferase family protein [Polyangiaceae bacterium]|nr:lysophospholipid acyltransferase family protein [Polyangiaceae bacterium]